jgi:hypothetical protein
MDSSWTRILIRGRDHIPSKEGSIRPKVSRHSILPWLADNLMDLGYRPAKADPDVWLRSATKPDGFEYYEMAMLTTFC